MLHLKSSMRRIILLTGAAFVALNFVFYCIFAYHNRYQTDDLAFTAKINELGLNEALKDFFLNWEANFTSIILFLLLNFFQDKNLLFLNGLIFLSNIFSLWFSVGRISKIFKIDLKNSESFVAASCIIVMLYVSVRAAGGVVYWSTAQIAYFIPLNFLFLAVGYWFSDGKGKSIAFASFFMFLFAHSRMNYVASFTAIYFYFTFLYFIQTRKFKLLLHLPFLFFLIGIVSYLLIPGVYKRITFHQNESLVITKPHTFFFYVKSLLIGIVHFYKMAVINIGFWFVFVISFCCGSMFSAVLPKLFRFFQIKKIIFVLCAFNVALLMHVIVILVALKTPIGYGRVFVFVEFLWLIFLIFTGLVAGTSFKYVHVSKASAILFFCLFIFFTVNKNINLLADAKLFSKQHDQRIKYLKQLKRGNNRSKIFIPALEGKEVFSYEDIQLEDTVNHIIPYPNYSIQQYYRLPFSVFLKK